MRLIPASSSPLILLDMLNDADDGLDSLTQARLTFALVSQRAQACRNKGCARRRLCLAPIGHMSNPTSNCPIMSAAEREVIDAGLRSYMQTMRQFIRASDEAWRAQVDALPKTLRHEVYTASRAESAAMWRRDRSPRIPLWGWLWTAIEGDRWINPTARDASKANTAIIARYGDRGAPRQENGPGATRRRRNLPIGDIEVPSGRQQPSENAQP